ncbi:hypothetical protein L208DRAFT_1419435 [Tricholoma matsutake]|nr:hypothetical protein L208DRAFT_1419435 [Tricholoma matsutake 945]
MRQRSDGTGPGTRNFAMKVKFNEENFGKAESQACWCWTDTTKAVPCNITSMSDELHIQAKLSGSELAMKSFMHQIRLKMGHSHCRPWLWVGVSFI